MKLVITVSDMAVSGICSSNPDIDAYYEGSFNSVNQDVLAISKKMLHDFLSEVKQSNKNGKGVVMRKFFLLVIIIATTLLGAGCEKKRILPWLKINGGFTLYVQGSGIRDYQGSTYWDRYYLISEPFDSRFNLELPGRPGGLVYKDFNQDGIKDIAITSLYGNIKGDWRITKVAFGKKDGNFNKNFQELPPKLIKRNKIKIEKGNKKSLDYGS